MSTAKAITQALAAKGIQRRADKAIYLVLMDGPRSVCMTDAMLDTWFQNLTPERKAEICEAEHDGPAELDEMRTASVTAHHMRGGVADWMERFTSAMREQQSECLELLNHQPLSLAARLDA